MNTRAVGGTPLENSEDNSGPPPIGVSAAAATLPAKSLRAAVPAESLRADEPIDTPAASVLAAKKEARRGPGAPKGNRNAVRHGLYTAKGRARRAEIKALLASCKAAIKRGEKVLAKRKARAANPRKLRLVPGAIRTRSGKLIFVRRTAGTLSRRREALAGLSATNPGRSQKGEMA